MKKLRSLFGWLFVLLAAGVFSGHSFAASVGAGGYTNSFSVQPAATDWSTLSSGGVATDITTVGGIDALVQGLTAGGVTGALVPDSVNPPAINGSAQWCSSGFYLQTRPTGNAASHLMCTLVNNLGVDAIGVTISYDFAKVALATEEVPGQTAYYSLSGAAGSWVMIPQFSSANPGRLSATLNVTWPNGSPLYILWADDNDSPSPDTACQIDNFSAVATPGNQFAVAITNQPQSQVVGELSPVSFSVGLSGYLPPTLQWYTNDVAIAGATGLTYIVASMPLSYNGLAFKVIAQNVASNVTYYATSSPAILTVNADTTPPVLLGAVGSGLNQVVASFSERLALVSVTNVANYNISGVAGTLTISNATLDSSQTNLLLSVSTMTTGAVYTLTVNGVTDQSAAANAIAINSQAQFTAASLAYVDLGNPAVPGSVVGIDGGFNISGTGTNISGTNDQFTFAYQQIAGNFDLKVRFQSFSAANAFARAGLMARENLTAGSRFAAAMAGPNIFGTFFEARATAGAAATFSGNFPANYPYTWLRLQRAGDVLTGYGSFDGQNWVFLGTATLASLPTTMFVGFAACSASASQTALVEVRDFGSGVGGSVGPFVPTREPLGASTRRTGLVISEIMYHPRSRPDGKQLEFIEIYNSQSHFEDISGYRLSGDVNYTFATGTVLRAGQFLVLAKVAADVQSVYGISNVLQYGITEYKTNVVGSVTNVTTNIVNSLDNGGGSVRLHNKAGAVLLDATFSTKYPWPIQADGGGHSLVLARPTYGEANREAWAASDSVGGSPGGFDLIAPEPARTVVVNEFLAHTDPPLEDMIELYNHGNSSVDISGFWLSDDLSTNKFRIPDGTLLGPRGFVSFGQATLGFALTSSGERIVLVNSNQTRVIDAVGFEGQENGVSMGRYPDGAPTFRRLSAITAGTTNAPPKISPIVINEIMYNPISGNSDDEFIELYNRSTNAVNVGDWKFTDGITFTFPANTVMAPGAYMVVAKKASRLQTNYNNLGPTNLMGDYDGTLANSGEHLALAAPDYEVVTNGIGQVFTNVQFYFVVNDITYGTGGRWGNWADGLGSSLELVDPQADNSLAANWADSDESTKGSWTSFEFTGTADNPLSGQGVGDRLEVLMLGVGECLVDDVEVRIAGGANVIANPSFESGLSGWTLQGSHDQSFVENSGFTGTRSLHILAASRGDNGGNRIQTAINPTLAAGTGTLRAKARWLRGFPEVLLRVHGGVMEAFGRLPVPTNLGSPGARNSRAVTNAGPAVYEVTHNPPLPAANQPVQVTARVHDPNGISRLTVRFRPDPPGSLLSSNMVDDGTGGDAVAGDGLFTATLPGQASGTLIAFYVEAVDGTGVTNVFPANATVRAFPNDAPSHECLIRWGEVEMPGSFATYHLWITAAVNTRWTSRDKLNNAPLDGTFVYNNYRVVYNMKPQYAGSPWHTGAMQGPMNPGVRCDYVLQFPDDDKMLGVNDFVLNTVGNPSGNNSSDFGAMAEQTSYEIFKAIGIHYNYRRYIHLFVDGDQRSITGGRTGNFIMEDSQQPNGDVVAEWFPDDADGQLYKIEDWFEFPDDGGNSGTHSNDDADLQRRTTTYNGASSIKIAPYRFMWRKRSVSAGDSANDYTNILSVIDIVSPSSNPGVSPLPDTVVKQFGQVVDFEQWFRILGVQHTIGNWDSYGYERGKNCYTYRPNHGKFNLMTWDIDFTLGTQLSGHGPQQTLFDVSDQRIGAMNNTPETVRAYWRALQDIVNGPLQNSYLNPLLDARAAAFVANNINYDPGFVANIKTFITDRRNYIVGQLATVAGTWGLGSTNFTSSSNIVTLTGTAPIDVKFIEINGVSYPVTWTATTAWSLRLPMNATGTNSFIVQAFDRVTNAIPNTTRTVTVNFTGTIEQPETNVVFNEIMYNPLQPGAEYVELFNRSTSFTYDLSGWRINGLDYTFPEGATIGPRGFLVLTKDRVEFANAFGGGVTVFDQFPGALQSDGETLTLIKPGATPEQDVVVDKVRYEGAVPWPIAANETGSSLQLIDAAQDNARVGNWFSSFVPAVYAGGSSTPAMTNDGWRFVSVNGGIGNGVSAQMRLVIYLGTELGTALIDDISVVAGTNAEVGANYVRNGDFEAPLIDDPPLTNSWMVGTNYTNSLIVSGLTHGGNGALKLAPISFGNSVTITATATNNKVIYQALSPAPLIGSTNTLSFWYWATNSSTNLSIKIINSAAIKVDPTNINITITPSNYVPPSLVSPATNTLSPGTANQMITNLPAFPPLWINEVQPDNLHGIVDNASEHDPWIEIYNAGTNTVSLDGLYLSTSYTNLTNWAFPAGLSISGRQFLIVFCDAQPGQSTPTEPHTSFRLPSGSGSIVLSRLNTNLAPALMNAANLSPVLDYVNYAGLHSDRSYGSYPDGQPFERAEFFYVTPGGTNDGRSAPLNVFINEWMASNGFSVADPADQDFEDWFEIYNPGTNTVDLAGYYLTGTLTNKTKFLVTANMAHTIPPHGHLLVWADNESAQNSPSRTDMHVNFKLSASGEAIGIFAADGTQIDAITFGQQIVDISQGRFPDGGPNIYTMTNPTPRAANYVPGVGGNNAPILNPIGSKSVFVGQTLSFTATATDLDAGQALGFTLDVGAPPGASIDFNTGAFTWTPVGVDTNVITVRVTDNGAPALDDYENVVVRVVNLPDFATPMRNGNDLTLSWAATPGRTYRVEYKNNLNDANWTQYGQDLTAGSDTLSVVDDLSNAPQRFYRLTVVQ